MFLKSTQMQEKFRSNCMLVRIAGCIRDRGNGFQSLLYTSIFSYVAIMCAIVRLCISVNRRLDQLSGRLDKNLKDIRLQLEICAR